MEWIDTTHGRRKIASIHLYLETHVGTGPSENIVFIPFHIFNVLPNLPLKYLKSILLTLFCDIFK